jgi:hypothetical protein
MDWKSIELAPTDFNADVSPPSLPPGTVNVLSNVDFYAGVARSLSDLSSITVPSLKPVAIQGYGSDPDVYVAYCGEVTGSPALGVYAWGSLGTHINIMPSTGLTGAGYWDTTAFGKWLVVTSDTVGELPHAISGAQTTSGGKLAPLPGWQSTWECTVIKTHRNVLWAADTIESGVAYPNRVRWSASSPTDSLPSTWLPSPSNDAGVNDLEILGGRIVDMCAVGDVMYIGGAGGLWAARWVGGQYVYNFSQISGQAGPRGLRCMESLGQAVAVLTANDLLIVNENTTRSIAIGRMASIIRQFVTAELMYISTSRQLIVFYSLVNETGYQHALIWDQDTDTWGKRDFPSIPVFAAAPVVIPVQQQQITWDSDTNIWDTQKQFWEYSTATVVQYMVGNASGLYVAQGKSYNWFLSKTLIAAPDNENIRVRSLEVDIDGVAGQNITIRMGSCVSTGDSPIWGPQRTYTVGDGTPIRHDDVHQGRYFSFQLQGNGPCKINIVRLFMIEKKAKP